MQVDDTRMSQQAWKRDEDFGDETSDENGDEEGGVKKPKGKGKGKRKAKGKAKTKAAPKKDKKKEDGEDKRQKKDRKSEKEKHDKQEQAPKRTGKKGKGVGEDKVTKAPKKTKDVPDPESLVTPARSKRQVETGTKDGSGGKVEKKARKTFARRYRPATEHGGALWDALKSAFVSIVAVRMKAPATTEASNSIIRFTGVRLLFALARSLHRRYNKKVVVPK